jgi:fatty-acyl-CoA synthase
LALSKTTLEAVRLLSPRTLAVLAAAGVLRPHRPLRLLRATTDLVRWGPGPAAGCMLLAGRFPAEVGLVDERGALTFGELHRRTNALADALFLRGVKAGDMVAIMCRNHRGFVEATIAAAKLGADVLYLNTALAAPQIRDVLAQQPAVALVYDEEFTGRLTGVDTGLDTGLRLLAWRDTPLGESLEDLIATGSAADRDAPRRQARTVILTSGTTGAPRAVSRGASSLAAATSLLSVLPLRARWRTHIASPLFHTWGWAHFQLGLLLGSTLVLRRHFEPFDCLETVSIYGCDSLAVVPAMMQRILRLPAEVRRAFALDTVAVVATSGSALPGDLARDWMDGFGDTLYNVYGSTECAWASIATPADLRAAPGTAGRPPAGTAVRLYDDVGAPAPVGEPGRIFVGNSMLFEGYLDGGGRPVVDGLVSTGDVGYVDQAGRLFVHGRADDMVVSGGENVFPQEVEDCLVRHPDVLDAAVVGVHDPELGQRLRAFVVLRDGAATGEVELKAHVKVRLADFKVPREIRALRELPRNATGKLVKGGLG